MGMCLVKLADTRPQIIHTSQKLINFKTKGIHKTVVQESLCRAERICLCISPGIWGFVLEVIAQHIAHINTAEQKNLIRYQPLIYFLQIQLFLVIL